MGDFLRATAVLFQSQLSSALRSKRFLVCALLAGLPVLFALFLTLVVPSHEKVPVAFVAWGLVAQIVCPIVALVFGSAVVSEEVSDRTITYLFSRPIPRASVLFGRWFASLVVVSALLAASAAGVVVPLAASFPNAEGSGPPLEMLLPFVGALVLGAAVYSAGFAALATFVKHAMIVGLGYVFAFEVMLVNLPLPGNLQDLTVQYYLRSLVRASGVEAWQHEILFKANVLTTLSDAGTTLGVALVVCLAIGASVLSVKQYELSA